ncbi:MAG TPA: hypothetical protein VJQ50_11000 [Terriglobales bacterium]|nr:hypothetical protein [Terriglobales bacterium]
MAAVVAVLGFAAYISIRSKPEPASAFKVAVNSGVGQPGIPGHPPQTASRPAMSSRPVAQNTRLPEQEPSLVRATVARRPPGEFNSRRSYPQLRSAVEVAPSADAGTQAVSAAPGQPTASSGPGVKEAQNSASGPEVAFTNNPPQPGVSPAPAAAPATVAPASAVLMPHGSVMLNGKSAADSTALFPGDRVQVAGGSYASINGKGSLLVLQPGSSVVYTGKALDLQQGGVAVSTLDGMPVNTEGLSVTPRTGHGKYDVLDDNGSVQIASLEGDLNILDGGQATVLPAGQQTTRDRRKKAADDPPQGPPETPPATASGGFPTGKVLLIGGAVGGGVAAAILLTRSSSKPVSPAVP